MKKILLISLLVFISTACSFSQSIRDIQLKFCPNYSYRTFRNDSGWNVTSADKPKPGFSASLNATVWSSGRLSFITGIEYDNKGYKSTLIYPDEQGELMETLGRLDYHYVSIPLYVKYTLLQSRVSISPQIGISYGRLAGVVARYNQQRNSWDWKEMKESDIRRGILDLRFGMEAGYKISPKIMLLAEPSGIYTITDELEGKEHPLHLHMYSAGLRAGLKYEL